MIRKASLCGRLVTKMRGKEAVVNCVFLPHELNLQSCVKNYALPSLVSIRKFSITKKLKEDKVLLVRKNQLLEADILALNSVEDVLDAAVLQDLHASSVNLLLRRLTELQRQEDSKSFNLEIDARFTRMTSNLADRASDLSSFKLIDCLNYLLLLMKEDSAVIMSLEKQVKAAMLRFTFPQLLRVAQMHKTSCETSLRQTMYQEAMTVLEKRWVEIKNPKDLVSMFYLVSNEKVKLLANLEEKVLELSESMNVKDLYRILYLMAKRNCRNTPVIRSLVYHMNKFTLALNTIQLANLSYACAKLSIYDSDLMHKIVEEMLVEDQATASEMSSLLHSFGLLRWCDPGLMDTVVERFLAGNSSVPPDSWATLLVTAACINYLPPSLAQNMPGIIGQMKCLQETDPRTWLAVVWSCVILLRATSEMLSSVFSEGFLSTFKEVLADQNRAAAYMKLLNVNAAAKLESSGYTGPLLSESMVENFVKELSVPSCTALTDCLLDTLNNMANLNKYIRTNVKTSAGFLIDAEMIVNSTGELQPTGAQRGSFFGSLDLGQGLHRIAVQLFEFGDMTQGKCIHPTGPNVLIRRLLSQAGYKVIQIPYTELNMKMTAVERVQYLNKKIKAAVGQAAEAKGSQSAESNTNRIKHISLVMPPSQASQSTNQNVSPHEPSSAKEHESRLLTPSLNIEKAMRSKEPVKHFVKLSMKDIFSDDSQPQSNEMVQKAKDKIKTTVASGTEKLKVKSASTKTKLQ